MSTSRLALSLCFALALLMLGLAATPVQAQTPTVSIVADDADKRITEGADVVFTLTRSNAPATALSVALDVSQIGTYAAASGATSATIAASQSTAKFTVGTSGPNTNDGHGSITVSLGSGADWTNSTTANSDTVLVLDDDGPRLSLSSPVTSFVEGSQPAITMTVSVTNSVQFTSTADNTIDYRVTQSGGQWVQNPGSVRSFGFDLNSNTDAFEITIADNTQMGSGQIVVALYEAAYTALPQKFTIDPAGSAVTITIVDDDLPAVSITADDADNSVAEGSDVVFTISSTDMPAGGLAVPVTVSQMGNYAVSGGTGSSTVRIPGGQTSVKFTVHTDDDNTDENDGSITATIGTLPATHAAGTMNSATVTVTDNEGLPFLRFPPDPATVADTADEFVAVFTLVPQTGQTRGAVSDKTVTIEYATADETAIAGTDYAMTTGILTFLPGENTANITVDIIAPDADEVVDEFRLSLDVATRTNLDNFVGGVSVNPLIVQIVEKPSLSITRNSEATIPESGSATFTVAITLPQSEAVVVPVTAVETGNVLGAVPPSVTIAAGQSSAVLNLPLDNDGRDEEDSTVTLSIALPSGSGDTYSLGTSEATLDVTDDDDAPVISFAPAEAVEGMPLQFRVSLSGASERTVRVNYETESAASDGSGGMPGGGDGSASGTATAGDDYMARMLTTLVFLPGEVEKIIEVQTMRDQVEDPDETVILLLSLPADANATLPGFTPGMEGQPGMPVRVVGTISEGLNDDEIQALNEAILPHVAATVADETSLAISDRINAAFDGGGAAGPSAFQPYVDLLRGDEQEWINTASALANGGIQSPAFMPQDFNFTYYPGRSRAQNHSSLPGRSRAQNHSGGPSHSGRNHSPLEGESVGQGRQPAATPVGGLNSGPPTASGFAYGSPSATPPQGGSDVASGFIQSSGSNSGIFGDNLAIWGRGYYRDISAEKGPIAFEGDVTGFMLGVDDRIGDYLLGIALNQANAEVEWDDSNFTGTHETTVAGIHPYFGWQSSQGHRFWASLGYERGELELLDDGNSNFLYKKDIALRTASLGGYGPIYEDGAISVAFVADSVYAQLEETDDSTVKIETGWLRGGVELDYDRSLDDGTVFGLNAGLALRHDYGDAKEGAGVEVSGGIEYHAPAAGIRLTLDGRSLIINDSDTDDWGISGSIAWQPNTSGRGLSFTFTPQWGSVNSVRDRLLAGGYARTYHSPLEGESEPLAAPVGGLNSGPPTNAAAGYALAPPAALSHQQGVPQGGSDSLRHRGTRPQMFYTAEAKYGIPIMQQRELLVLFARIDFHGDAKNHAVGADLNIGKYFSTGVEVNAGTFVNSAGDFGYTLLARQPTTHWSPQEADRPGIPSHPNREMMHRAYLRYERQF